MGTPTLDEWEGWISGGDRLDDDARMQASGLISRLAELDWAWADADRLKREGALDKGKKKEQEAEELRRSVRPELEAILAAGLARRIGQRLQHGELRVFLQLAARLAVPNRQTYVRSFQVCERCDLVFETKKCTARHCAKCRGRELPRVYPRHSGGWHIDTHGDPADGTLVYFAECECGAVFSDRRANQRLCQSCRNNAGRQRRFRGRQSAATDEVGLARLHVEIA